MGYVLCPNCALPETDMAVKKSLVVAKCKACGWHGELDNDHRLAKYIAKNPPTTVRKKKPDPKVEKNEDDDETASYQSEWEETARNPKGGPEKEKARKGKKEIAKEEKRRSRDGGP